jgi:hypothetical protein
MRGVNFGPHFVIFNMNKTLLRKVGFVQNNFQNDCLNVKMIMHFSAFLLSVFCSTASSVSGHLWIFVIMYMIVCTVIFC